LGRNPFGIGSFAHELNALESHLSFSPELIKTSSMKSVIALALMLIGTSAFAQTATNTTGNQTNAPAKAEKPPDLGAMFRMHYDNRVRSFKEQNLAWRNVVLLGDSITEGFDVTKYLPGRRVVNRGIGADVIGNALPPDDNRGVLKRLDNSVFDCAATDVFLLIGINDLGSGRQVDVMEQGYRELLKRIHEQTPAIKVHVQSVLPTRGRFAKHNEPVRDFNQRIRKLADEFKYDFIDLHSLMVDAQGELKAEFTNDGLHLNDAAYRVWRTEILKVMKWE
jgi:lysophospholipase L1-like esterase